MSELVRNLYFDTCTLSNFATVGRLDLLERRCGNRARWTETVRYEVSRGLSRQPYLQQVLDAGWLGTPVEVGGDPKELEEIERIRRALGGGSGDHLRHLGEAEMFHHLENHDVYGVLVTDDRPALDFAGRRGIATMDTVRLLAECHAQGEIGCPAAFDLLVAMSTAGRGVRVPAHHRLVCP